MKTDELLAKLQEKKNLIDCYSNIDIVTSKSDISENVLEVVKADILEYVKKRINEIDGDTTEDTEPEAEKASESPLRDNEISILRKFISRLTVDALTAPASVVAAQPQQPRIVPPGEDIYEEPGVGLITKIIQQTKKKEEYAILDGEKVRVMAASGGNVIIKHSDGTKEKVPLTDLKII